MHLHTSQVSHAIQALTINTTASCKAGHEGLTALLSVIKNARSITDLTISKVGRCLARGWARLKGGVGGQIEALSVKRDHLHSPVP